MVVYPEKTVIFLSIREFPILLDALSAKRGYYFLKAKSLLVFFVESSETSHMCPICHSYHTELPDCLVPYKHYEAEVISGVLDEVVRPENLDSEDYPSFSTMRR